MLDVTGCDGVMVGRAAIGNPLIFTQIIAELKHKEVPLFEVDNHFDIMRRYLHASIEYLGEDRACQMMRSRLGWFAKGLPHSSKFRESIRKISSRQEALDRIRLFQNTVNLHFNNFENRIGAKSKRM